MKQVLKYILLFFFVTFNSCAQNTIFINNGNTDYTIYYVDSNDKNNAKIVQKYIKDVSGALLTLKQLPKATVQKGLIIGKTDKVKIYLPVSNPIANTLYIKNHNRNIIITSTDDKGVTYAVYTFIEEVLGCRNFYEGGKFIPSKKIIEIPSNYSIVQTPAFDHRQYWYFGSFVPSQEYLDWHKLHNYHTDKEWGMYMVHNLDQLVPDNLINSKPNFFSLTGQGRSINQLNFSDNNLQQFLIERVADYFKKNPNEKVLALNPKDNEDYCLCETCKKIYEKEGSKMGTLLIMVNKVALQFPNKQFVVQAFKSNRTPPKNIIPLKNVKIVVSDIEVTRLYDIRSSNNPRVKLFRQDLDNWLKKTDQVIVWDYINWFENSFIPFPNFANMASNAKYFAEKRVKGVFWEGDGGLPSFQHKLRGYIAAKLLWNPKTNVEALTQEFLNYYYEGAAPIMRKYLDEMENAIKMSNIDIETGNSSFYDDASKVYLSKKQIVNYYKLLNKAKANVKTNQEIINRIELDEMGLLIYEIELEKRNKKIAKEKIENLEKMFKKHNIEKYNYYLEYSNNYIKSLKSN
ncbi:DUF4838 domain-containing protein [Flavobacterium sp. xlx-214]|uniref:DUF4838 domain-containing protein n=1 Tax=unclassified Flavobacterium TaxID=196869 RepID=UPI0013CF6D4E|nr:MULTISPECIES: DUF4838 domain-containing protein [unclassified Flavobacterium]MBA5794010.1 DUF4838 domain-containing protein [Flavobacterium sp. xlx-221]QMI83173.1 DUF4838 domain-containing protein [Flavobacterium sp. xlx-214]